MTRQMLKAVRLITGVGIFLLLATSSFASEVDSRENRLKAAYLLNFARFVYWPEEVFSKSEPSMNICVYRDANFLESIDAISNRKVNNKKIKLLLTEDARVIDSCHIIYFSQKIENEFEKIIPEIGDKLILTVSDANGFVDSGGLIELIEVDNKYKFIINDTKSKRAGIRYRSQLLEVAESVK